MTEILTRTTPAPTWVDEVDGPLRCTEIVDITPDVRSFGFVLPVGQLRFLPGQYLTFSFEIDGVQVERCYTISSTPTRPDQLTITVKRVPGGEVSNWLHDQLAVGDIVRASGPYGQFSHAFHPSGRYLFLTAGSGITPAMSMLRAITDRSATTEPVSVVFVHCARTPDDIIFRAELEDLATRYDVELAVICEDDSAAEQWTGHRGRLTLPVLFSVAPDLLDRDVFSCGPAPYMAAVREMLELIGADPARRHEESFVLGDGPEVGDDQQSGISWRIEFAGTGRTIDCDAATTILQAATRAGIAVPSSCTEGVCGTCKTRMISGSVDLQHAGGIRQREIDQGKILLCCSRPQQDVVLDA
ncbi:hybrid-cluster NAD(P)-dependent oxidoreductase [Microlunatus soli]|uniref:Ferredoxin-NADP reductase n=1 Tax=Microlunatus soli TaxID=630515 RepID=A0A1H1XR12_9ACTN|nr:hybrid-cluster NAD(P)-dependent oxidoreductase [Microlunatus soli]SDT11236.1 Ferredoxin-NADP reductase [Microlunatus soli]